MCSCWVQSKYRGRCVTNWATGNGMTEETQTHSVTRLNHKLHDIGESLLSVNKIICFDANLHKRKCKKLSCTNYIDSAWKFKSNNDSSDGSNINPPLLAGGKCHPYTCHTRKYSNRMRTTNLETMHALVSVVTRGRCGSLNEQVWTGLQWSPPDVTKGSRSQVWCTGVGGYPYHVTYSIMLLMLPTYLHGQTDTCENITFPQLCLPVVYNPWNFDSYLRKTSFTPRLPLHPPRDKMELLPKRRSVGNITMFPGISGVKTQ